MISVLVPFRPVDQHRKDLFSHVYRWWESHFSDAEFVFSDTVQESFNRAGARNVAARQAKGDVFVFADADTVPVDPQQVLDAVELAKTTGWALPYTDYYNLTEAATARVLSGDQAIPVDYEYHFPSPSHPEPAVAGVVVVDPAAYWCVEGYDERFLGWGEEDRAFILALETCVSPIQRILGEVWHLWHPAPESVRFEQPYFLQNRELCNRYREVQGNRESMMELCQEHQLPRNRQVEVVE